MTPGRARFALVTLLAALLGGSFLLAAASPAPAETVNQFRPGTDTVSGEHPGGDAVLRLPFRLSSGSILSLDVRAGKGSAFRPAVVVLGTDRLPDGDIGLALKLSKKGDRVTLKNHRAEDTGLRWLELRAADGAAGSWTLKSKMKAPRSAAGTVTLGSNGKGNFSFDTVGGATATVKAGAARGSLAPEFDALNGPAGTVLVDDVRPSKKGFSLVSVLLAQAGPHTLVMHGVPGDDAVVKVSLKAPKLEKRDLDAADVVADPVVLAVSPSELTAGAPTGFSIRTDFALPGASVVFTRPTTSITVQPGTITVDDDSVDFTLGTANMPAGTWDVSVQNSNGGVGTLAEALLVRNPQPAPLAMTPAEGYDDQTVRSTISGSGFVAGVTVSLKKGASTIVGTVITVSGSSIVADFDLNGVAEGPWDLSVANPSTTATVLPAAFNVLKRLEFHVDAMSPADNLEGPVVGATITGVGFEEGATVRLEPDPEGEDPVIHGTGVEFVSPTELAADFDMSGTSPGPWTLVVRLSDGRESSLPLAFATRGEGGDPVHVMDPVVPADAPMALAWNATRGEYLVAWMEEDPKGIVLQWNVKARRVDAMGNPLGAETTLYFNTPLATKRTVAAGWDPDHDEYLVAWAEEVNVTLTNNGQSHPNGKGNATVDQVVAVRLNGVDLSAAGKVVQVSDHTAFPAGSKLQWYVDEFRNFRPSVSWDPVASRWEIAWMQEFDTRGTQAVDDFNVFRRTLDPSNDALGSLVEVGVSPYHEGDPSLAWDSNRKRTVMAWNARNGSDAAPLDVRLSSPGGSATVASGVSGEDLADPRLTVDTTADRVLVTWTRVPLKGIRTVEGQVLEAGNLATVGKAVPLGEGTVDLLGAVPVYNPATGDVLVCWAEADLNKGNTAVRRRVFKVGADDGPVALGEEDELSAGTGDEGGVSAAFATGTGEVGVFWYHTLSLLPNTGGYPGNVVPADGTVRGAEIWMRRFR